MAKFFVSYEMYYSGGCQIEASSEQEALDKFLNFSRSEHVSHLDQSCLELSESSIDIEDISDEPSPV